MTGADRRGRGGAADPQRFAQFERAGWAARSATYDAGFARVTAGVHGVLLDAAAVAGGTRLLEVGCGTGRLSRAAVERGARVVATDAVAGMVRAAAATLSGAGQVVQAGLPALPFPDATFDAVAGAFVINHVPDPPAAVRELARVTRAGGRVALSCWDAAERNRAQGVFFEAAAGVRAVPPDGVPAVTPFIAHSGRAGFARLMRGAGGLREVRVERVRWTHRVDPERWWDDVVSGTVLTSALLTGQEPNVRKRMRAAYRRLVAPYDAGDGTVLLPVAALVATGVP